MKVKLLYKRLRHAWPDVGTYTIIGEAHALMSKKPTEGHALISLLKIYYYIIVRHCLGGLYVI